MSTANILVDSLAREEVYRRVGSDDPPTRLRIEEERHREMLTVLDRIACALEEGNRLTQSVMEKT